jgi:serine/threonine protein phosphatase PrpC
MLRSLTHMRIPCVKWRRTADSAPQEDYSIEAAVLSDAGCYREGNEDRVRYVEPADVHVRNSKGVLAIMADGMGGHQSGEIASTMAVDAIDKHYYASRRRSVSAALKRAFAAANKLIYATAHEEPSLHGMGTTATALVIRKGLAYFAHVGDSRLYRLRNDQLSMLSEDHSFVNDLLKQGLISAADARHHPNRNIITRAIGTHPSVDVQLSAEELAVERGDRYVLCTDGLHDLVSDVEIRDILLTEPPYEACNQLIGLAKQRGGYDNISVTILAIKAPGEAKKNTPPTRV